MRYYDIDIFEDSSFKTSTKFWSSLDALGNTNPGALNVEFDIPLTPANTPIGNVSLRIWGVMIADMATNWQGKYIQIRAGMAKGLPLANPSQRGLILQGQIFQSFGNWQGTEMYLDFIIQAGTGGWADDDAKNYVFDWRKGSPISDAIQTTLKNALSATMPSLAIKIMLDATIIAVEDACHFCGSLTQFAQLIYALTRKAKPDPKYKGALIVQNGNEIVVSDSTTQSSSSKVLSFQDFIGQPTWLDPVTISAKVVVRHDLTMLDYVTLPDIQAQFGIVRAKSNEFIRNGLTFSGRYQITALRHIGNFRQQDANSWVTVLNLTPETVAK